MLNKILQKIKYFLSLFKKKDSQIIDIPKIRPIFNPIFNSTIEKIKYVDK